MGFGRGSNGGEVVRYERGWSSMCHTVVNCRLGSVVLEWRCTNMVGIVMVCGSCGGYEVGIVVMKWCRMWLGCSSGVWWYSNVCVF